MQRALGLNRSVGRRGELCERRIVCADVFIWVGEVVKAAERCASDVPRFPSALAWPPRLSLGADRRSLEKAGDRYRRHRAPICPDMSIVDDGDRSAKTGDDLATSARCPAAPRARCP